MLLIIAQIVGIAAVALYLFSFQLKHRKHLVFVTCVSNCLYVLQYFLLGAFSGAVLDMLSTVSSYFAAKKNKPSFQRYAKAVSITLLTAIVAVGLALTFIQKKWVELLPVAGAIFQTSGLWFNNEQTIRKFALVGAPFWLCYNFLSQAYGAAAGSLLTIVSIIVSLLRYRKSKTQSA